MRKFSWSGNSHPSWPSWKAVQPLELVLVVLIIMAATASLLAQVPAIQFKTRFTEVLEAMHLRQIAIIENHAITGRGLDSDAAEQTSAGGGALAGSDYESRLSGRGLSFATPSDGSPVSDSWTGRRERSGVVQGTSVAIGRIPGYPKPFQLAIRAAWEPGEARATVMWVCGLATVPPGITVTPAKTLTTLPPENLPSVCRGEKP